jgi:hypothetical protein
MRYRTVRVGNVQSYLDSMELMKGADKIVDWAFHSALPAVMADGAVTQWIIVLQAPDGTRWLEDIFAKPENVDWLTERVNAR